MARRCCRPRPGIEPRFDAHDCRRRNAPLRTEQLDALVIAVAGAAAVADRRTARRVRSSGRASRYRCRPAPPISGSIRQAPAAYSSTKLLAHEPRRRVEVVDGEILEQAAAARNEAEGGVAGSWLMMWSVSSAAASPASKRRLSSLKVRIEAAIERRQIPGTGAFPDRAMPRPALSASSESGFSQNTALPAPTAAVTFSRCELVELATTTALTSGSAKISS